MHPGTWARRLGGAASLCCAMGAAAQQPPDVAAALDLADQAVAEPATARDWRASLDLSGLWIQRRAGNGEGRHAQRVSVDLSFDTRLAPDWRFRFADRLDGLVQDNALGPRSVNTLKEAYASWQPSAVWSLDLGRVNVRNGTAAGYNPTDYFREGAVRSVVSAAPSSLRENRQGSVMLRAQRVWDGGSLTGLYSPRLEREADSDSFDLDFGATNFAHRWQLAWTQRWREGLAPQLLLTGGSDRSAQIGANVSALLSDKLIAFGEWSGGRGREQVDRALGLGGANAWRQRSSLGLTLTTSNKMNWTLEYEHNGAAPGRAAWAALAPAERGAYAAWAQNQQETFVRENWFVLLNWQEVFVRQLDVNAFVRHNPYDRSTMYWAEARYHLRKVDLVAQAQFNRGRPGSSFGSIPQESTVRLGAVFYFP